jgi:GNAT superfamily N-acetyltransferase
MASSTHIRPATAADTDLIVDLIRDLAVYEKLEDMFVATPAVIREALFAAARPAAEVLIAELDGKGVGFALFFHNYSTFLGKKGIYLEDLFVKPEARGHGLGKGLLRGLAQIAVQRDCARMEWSVLDWNTPSIDFYKSLGAAPMDGWHVFRMTREAIGALAEGAPGGK